MFTNLSIFPQEKETYHQTVQEIMNTVTDEEERNKKLEEAQEKFKGQVRKYLPSALDVIKTTFQCQYSIYKVGKDFDANFHVVETNVRKSKSEVLAEMEQLKAQAASMTLNNEQITKINLAMDVLLTYSDDVEEEKDETRTFALEKSKVIASSIVETPTRENNAFEPAPADVQPNFNPYANQPVVLEDGFSRPSYDDKGISNPFASLYGETPSTPQPSTNAPVENPSLNNNNNNTGDLSIFGVGPTSGETANYTFVPPTPTPTASPSPMEPNMVSQPMPNGMMNNSSNMGMMTPQNYMSSSPMMGQSMMSQPGMMNQPMMNQQGMMTPMMAPMNNGMNPMMNGMPNTGMMGQPMMGQTPQNMPQNSVQQGVPLDRRPLKDPNNEVDKDTTSSRILSGLVQMPLTWLIISVLSCAVMIVLSKTGLLTKITDFFGDFYPWILRVMFCVIAFLGASSFVDLVASKTKQVFKYMVAALCLFVGMYYAVTLAAPHVIPSIFSALDLELVLYSTLYYTLSTLYGCLIGTLALFGSILRNETNPNVRMNLFEWVGVLWLLYALVIPTIESVMAIFSQESLLESIAFLYDYAHSNEIIMGVSFVLPILMFILNAFSKRKVRSSV